MPQKKSELKLRLEGWNLKRNPFPAVPFVDPFNIDPLQNGSVFASELRQGEIDFLRHDILGEGYTDQIRCWNWLWARKQYGSNLGVGKTALLTYVADAINKHDYGHKFFGHSVHWLMLYVPVQPNTDSVDKIAALALVSICNQVRGPSIAQLILAKLRRKVLKLGQLGQTGIEAAHASEHHFIDDKKLSDKGIDLSLLAKKVETLLIQTKVSPEIAKSFSQGEFEKHLEHIAQTPHIHSTPKKLTQKALSILLDDFALIAKAAEMSRIILILDNFYYIVRRTLPAQRPDLAAAIRAMVIDGNYKAPQLGMFNWLAVMHTQTANNFNSAWESKDMNLVAPLNVLDPKSLVLKPIPYKHGKEILQAYLNSQRLKKMDAKSFPFTDEALEVIVTAVRKDANEIFPRGLLEAAFSLMVKALQNPAILTLITPDIVQQILEGQPIMAPKEGTEETDADIAPQESKILANVVCPCTCHNDEEVSPMDVSAISEETMDDLGKPNISYYLCTACNVPVNISGNPFIEWKE